jgi:chromosome segregation ATPase
LKLKVLTIENFKGIKNFTLDADGQNVSIFGINGAGKTTVADSVAWLLYDQDSLGASLQPKPLIVTGEANHGICSDVEGVFILNDNGNEIKLKKSYYEKWTKKRGTAKAVFSGNVTNYYVDDVPVKKKEYNDRISEIATIPIMKLLSNVRHFSEELHWQDRRQILMDICGDISDADIIASNKELSGIPEILDGKSFEDQKKIITAQKAKLNKELNDLPVRIDEVDKSLPDMTDIELDIQNIEQKQKVLSIQLSATNEVKARIESGGEIAKKDKELRVLETDLLKIKNKDTVLRFQKEAENEKEKLRLENVKEVELSNQKKLANTIAANIEKNEIAEKAMAELRAKWTEINKSVFFESILICPTCGQNYQKEKAQKIKENFNIDKSKRLTDINKTGKDLATEVAERKEDSEAFEADIVTYDASIEKLSGQIKRLDNPESEKSDNPMQTKIVRDIANIKKEIEGLKLGSKESLEKAQADVDTVQKDLEAIALQKSSIDTYQKSLARIDELKSQQKVCASEFEKLEEKLFIMESFIKAKVALLETKVNNYFKLANFKLFETQVNGELNPICEVTYSGVPWNAGLNNGAKINVGIDIINTLMDFYGLTMPVFVDNAESVTDIIDSDSQIIRLVVDNKYKQLEVIKEGADV